MHLPSTVFPLLVLSPWYICFFPHVFDLLAEILGQLLVLSFHGPTLSLLPLLQASVNCFSLLGGFLPPFLVLLYFAALCCSCCVLLLIFTSLPAAWWLPQQEYHASPTHLVLLDLLTNSKCYPQLFPYFLLGACFLFPQYPEPYFSFLFWRHSCHLIFVAPPTRRQFSLHPVTYPHLATSCCLSFTLF